MYIFSIIIFSILSMSLWAQVDINASIETKNLYKRLQHISNIENDKIIFGQQNAFFEGRGWRLTENISMPLPSSDVKKVFGKNPALTGFDFNEIGTWNELRVIDQMNRIHKKNGLITLSWHMKALVQDEQGDGSSWDTTGLDVKKILNDSHYRNLFLKNLDMLINFAKKIPHIPIIFRPWHEHNYSWFWWGEKFCTPLEYINLYKLTYDYLTDHGIHNFLYAYSPNFVDKNYLTRYPGDNYIDILGFDIYFKTPAIDRASMGQFPLAEFKTDIFKLLEIAFNKNKIAAITEIGNEGVWYKNFWTDYFSWPMTVTGMKDWSNQTGLKMPKNHIAYAMIWRNDKDDPNHFFGPAPGHTDVNNFLMMNSENNFLYLEDLLNH